MIDARFEDSRFEQAGQEAPLRLLAHDVGDLAAMSALLQDALFTPAQMVFVPKRRRFAIAVNRFRWEDAERATAEGRGFERVQSLLVIDEVRAVQSTGFDRAAPKLALCVLAMSFAPLDAPGGWLRLHLAGGADLRLNVEALDLSLRDVARPYLAPSGMMPQHGLL